MIAFYSEGSKLLKVTQANRMLKVTCKKPTNRKKLCKSGISKLINHDTDFCTKYLKCACVRIWEVGLFSIQLHCP